MLGVLSEIATLKSFLQQLSNGRCMAHIYLPGLLQFYTKAYFLAVFIRFLKNTIHDRKQESEIRYFKQNILGFIDFIDL